MVGQRDQMQRWQWTSFTSTENMKVDKLNSVLREDYRSLTEVAHPLDSVLFVSYVVCSELYSCSTVAFI